MENINKKKIRRKIVFSLLISFAIFLVFMGIGFVVAGCYDSVSDAENNCPDFCEEFSSGCDFLDCPGDNPGETIGWWGPLDLCSFHQQCCPADKPSICAVSSYNCEAVCYNSSNNNYCCNSEDYDNARICKGGCCDYNNDGIDECDNMDTDGDRKSDACCKQPKYPVGGKYEVVDQECIIGNPYIEDCVECTIDSPYNCGDIYGPAGGSNDYDWECCYGECYDPDLDNDKVSDQLCCGNGCQPTVEKMQYVDEKGKKYGKCCDLDGDNVNGDEGFCTGETPYCELKYQLVEEECRLFTHSGGRYEHVCSECMMDRDCIGNPDNIYDDQYFKCCSGAGANKCYDEREEVCCGVADCQKLESRSSWPVKTGGTCYRGGDCNVKTELVSSVPDYYRPLVCDNVNCLVGTSIKDVITRAEAACKKKTPSLGVSGLLRNPLGAFYEAGSKIKSCTVMGGAHGGFATANWEFGGEGNGFKGFVSGGVTWYPVTQYKKVITGYEEIWEETGSIGRGGGEGHVVTQPVFGGVESSSLKWDPLIAAGPIFNVWDHECRIGVNTNMRNVGWQIGINLYELNQWLSVEAVYFQPPSGEAIGGGAIVIRR